MKRFLLATLLVLTLTLSACTPGETTSDDTDDDPGVAQLDVFYTNDVHGAIVRDDDALGLDHMANLMTSAKEENPDETLILDGGDALQGSAMSNYYEGESYIELMNVMEYDAMVVGNHEFDWGLETVTDYFKDDGIADFPLLGANIVDESTGEIPENVDPYTVVEKAGRTIGIIGTIGYGLENSIATSMVEGYSFSDPAPIVEAHAKTLRSEEGADLVLLLTHDPGGVNEAAIAFEGDARIDAVFNAHYHELYAYVEANTAVIQSGGNGSHVGEVSFSWDEYGLSAVNALNHTEYETEELSEPHPDIKAIIDEYREETDPIFTEPIIDAPSDIGSGDLNYWIADLMRHATGSDVGIQNDGGTRSNLASGSITLGDLYDIWPFENAIKTVELEGSTVKGLLNVDHLISATPVDAFDDDTLYKVATNDFVFDQEDGPFLDGENPEDTGLYIRDLAEEELTLQSGVYDEFNIDNPLVFTQD